MNRIVILLPTYNEKENVGALIPEIFEHVPDIFVLVIDDNSPDGTGEVIEALKEKFSNLSLFKREKKEGLGKAYRDAFKKCLNDPTIYAVIMMDADFSHHPRYLQEILKKGREVDVVVGSRYVKGGKTEGWELWRRLLSRWGNFYSRVITGIPVRDCTGGFNFIRTDMLRKLDFEKFNASGYAFTIELKFALLKAGARLEEVPIIFKNRLEGESKISQHIIHEGVLAPWKIILRK